MNGRIITHPKWQNVTRAKEKIKYKYSARWLNENVNFVSLPFRRTFNEPRALLFRLLHRHRWMSTFENSFQTQARSKRSVSMHRDGEKKKRASGDERVIPRQWFTITDAIYDCLTRCLIGGILSASASRRSAQHDNYFHFSLGSHSRTHTQRIPISQQWFSIDFSHRFPRAFGADCSAAAASHCAHVTGHT